MTYGHTAGKTASSRLFPNFRGRLLWAVCAIVTGVLIAGFWNYHWVDGFGKDFVAGQTIGDTERLSGSFNEQGIGFGFIFAIVAGLAATFTACNCVVFAMLPGLACSSDAKGSPRQLALKAFGVFTLAVLLVCFVYGAYVGSLGAERIGTFNERTNRLAQAQITFTILGGVMFVWGLIAFGFLDRIIAALFAADIAVVPVHLAMDDITAAHQLVNGHIPLVAENRGFPLPVMYVFTNNTVIDKRARALADLREIIQQDGTRIAGDEMPYRIAYKDMQTGTTLYAGGRLDPKAIAESEAIFAEIVQYVIEANQSAAAE